MYWKATLIDAETITIFAIEKLERQDTLIATNLAKTLKERIDSRRNATLMHLYHYLQDPKYLSKTKDFFGHKIFLCNKNERKFEWYYFIIFSILKTFHEKNE